MKENKMKKKIFILNLMFIILFAFTACDADEAINVTIKTETSELTEQPDLEQTDGIYYEFDNLGFSLVLPISWEGKYGLLVSEAEDGNRHIVTVYHIATREELGSEYVGTLFWLGKALDEVDTDNMPGKTIILDQVKGYTYYVNFPSDVQYNYEVPESEATIEFLEMESQIDFIINSFRLTDQ
jgi:hypothetical protein